MDDEEDDQYRQDPGSCQGDDRQTQVQTPKDWGKLSRQPRMC